MKQVFEHLHEIPQV